MTRRVGFALSLITALMLAGASVASFAESHARIVRVSYLDGQVQMDRATGQGLEKAILNAPVVQGASIVTGKDGLVEVEFEDQSALRLTDNSEVRFRQLSMSGTGAKTNDIEVVKGVVYFDLHSKTGDIYRVGAGGSSLLLQRDTQVRLSASPDQLRVAVTKGDVQLEGQPQAVSVKKKETLSLDPSNPSGYKVTNGTEPFPVDAWNNERAAYASTYAKNAGYGGPKTGYGLQDLNYYGNFFYAPGFGSVWQPYGFAGSMIGWNPYSNGAWMFYPGMGYTFASGYPWGWLPYHYGSWAFIGGGVGWAWVPGNYGGAWYANNFQTVPKIVKAPAGWSPASPPASPANSPQPTVMVGKVGPNAYIPGGRIPPNFASVVPGRMVRASAVQHGAVGANARESEHVFNSSAKHPAAQSGHVFAAPPPMTPIGSSMPVGGPTYSGASGSAGGRGSVTGAPAGASAAGPAGRAGAAGSAGHGAPASHQ